MEDRLAGHLTNVDADVETFDPLVLSQYVVSKLTNETLNRLSLGFAEIEERSCMPLGQDEAVELRDRRAEPLI